jgi:cytochrome P450
MSAPCSDVDLFGASFLEDPFPLYEQIRDAGRVVWNDVSHVWLVPGFEDSMAVLTDRGENFIVPSGDPKVIFWFDALNMIMVDGAEHTRLRAGLAPLFSRTAVARWEGRVGEVVDDLLQPLLVRPEGFELIADLSWIPTVIVAEMLGIPRDRHRDFRRWSHVITSKLSFGHESPEDLEMMRLAAREVNAYMREEVARHRKDAPDDLITAMLRFPPSNRLTDEEIVSTAIELLIAGYDTTAKVMSNCLVALERHPAQRAEVAEDLTLLPAAIEEVMRWWGLLQMNPRFVVRDTVLAGTALSAGDVLYVLQAAANRDPSRWREPLRFDILRPQKAHMGFGYGPHLCIGAWLARLETKVVVERLLELAPEYRIRDIDWGKAAVVRGPERGVVEAGPVTRPA